MAFVSPAGGDSLLVDRAAVILEGWTGEGESWTARRLRDDDSESLPYCGRDLLGLQSGISVQRTLATETAFETQAGAPVTEDAVGWRGSGRHRSVREGDCSRIGKLSVANDECTVVARLDSEPLQSRHPGAVGLRRVRRAVSPVSWRQTRQGQTGQ
jgi:hypothetical protein